MWRLWTPRAPTASTQRMKDDSDGFCFSFFIHIKMGLKLFSSSLTNDDQPNTVTLAGKR
jgi:hypothetical protein